MKKRITLEKMIRALKKRAIWGVVIIGVAVVPCLISCCENNPLKPESQTDQNGQTNQNGQTAQTAELINEKCLICHKNDDYISNYSGNWKNVVDRMIEEKGIDLTEEEAADIIAHLAEGKSY